MREVTRERFEKEIRPSLLKKLGDQSIMSTPQVKKVVVNCGLSNAKENKNIINEGVKALEAVAGQKAVVSLARQSIAGFKLREGMPIGVMVTLRRGKMYDFLSRLVNVYIPRMRDFKGLSSKSFDKGGSYTLGINDMRIFPEVGTQQVEAVSGVSITIVTSAKTTEEGHLLLEELGFPFKKA